MLFLAELSGGTGSDRHHSAPSTCTAAGFTRVSPSAARWLSARMATFSSDHDAHDAELRRFPARDLSARPVGRAREPAAHLRGARGPCARGAPAGHHVLRRGRAGKRVHPGGQRHRVRPLGPHSADAGRRHSARPLVGLSGMSLPTPLLLAPVGVIGLCAQDGHGELATARAAATSGVPMIVSTLSVDRSRMSPRSSVTHPGSSSSTRPGTASSRSRSCRAPRRPASRASSSRSAPGCQAGGHAT